jgi:hypothetical protein
MGRDSAPGQPLADFLGSLLPFVQFHSTIGYLKQPPQGYLVPGVDVIAGFKAMKQKLTNGGYMNQYQFATDVGSMVRTWLSSGFLAPSRTLLEVSGSI